MRLLWNNKIPKPGLRSFDNLYSMKTLRARCLLRGQSMLEKGSRNTMFALMVTLQVQGPVITLLVIQEIYSNLLSMTLIYAPRGHKPKIRLTFLTYAADFRKTRPVVIQILTVLTLRMTRAHTEHDFEQKNTATRLRITVTELLPAIHKPARLFPSSFLFPLYSLTRPTEQQEGDHFLLSFTSLQQNSRTGRYPRPSTPYTLQRHP